MNTHMAPQTHTESLNPHSHFYFPRKPSYTNHSTSMKIKAIVQAHILPQLCHVVHALTKAKSIVMELIKKNGEEQDQFGIKMKRKKMTMKKKRRLFGSITLCCNWPSSHVLPMPEQPAGIRGFDMSHMYYDSTWNSVISAAEEGGDELEPQLSGYLRWLEEKAAEDPTGEDETDEINRLAERFIAKCHEKFRLEKQESYRRYQEMLARSM